MEYTKIAGDILCLSYHKSEAVSSTLTKPLKTPRTECWYTSKPMDICKLENHVQKVSKRAALREKYTNRATTCTLLDLNFKTTKVMAVFYTSPSTVNFLFSPFAFKKVKMSQYLRKTFSFGSEDDFCIDLQYSLMEQQEKKIEFEISRREESIIQVYNCCTIKNYFSK